MRITILLAALVLLFIQPAFAVVAIPQSKVPTEKPPKVFYAKGKGTMGLIAGLTLGPFGWGGVCLVSHNRTQRAKAKQGCIIWTTVVVTTALIWLVVLAGKSGSSGSHHSSGSSGSKGHGSNAPNLSGMDLFSGNAKQVNPRRPEEQEFSELPLFLRP